MNRITFFFAWFDFWIGIYYNQRDKIVYICPLPMCVIRINLYCAITMKVLCPTCKGKGRKTDPNYYGVIGRKLPLITCQTCSGTGWVDKPKKRLDNLREELK